MIKEGTDSGSSGLESAQPWPGILSGILAHNQSFSLLFYLGHYSRGAKFQNGPLTFSSMIPKERYQ